MTTSRDSQIRRICQDALERSPSERDRYLREACGEDAILRGEVEALLARDLSAEGFLAMPAFEVEAQHVAAAEADLRRAFIGKTLSHYRIVGHLGAGGMGVVYRAIDTRLERPVALKVITRSGDADGHRRLAREARAASLLNHPNIVSIHDVDEQDGVLFLVMELVEGQPLSELLAGGPLSIDRALDYAFQMAEALETAHAAGIVHRDIKPANIMVSESGRLKILDFGLAKRVEGVPAVHGAATSLTETGVMVGTVAYMSPERAQGLPVDGRSDVFSFGVVAYEMLGGARAFQRQTPLATLTAILNTAPPPLTSRCSDLPLALVQLVDACLQKQVATRPTSQDVVRSLQTIRHHHANRRAKESTADALLNRRTTGIVSAAAAAVFVVVGATWMISHRTAASVAPSVPQTIAILPFRSLPASAGTELLEVGLADVLIGRFGQIPNVTAIPLTSTERLRGLDPVVAGHRLGATAVLSGTLQYDGGKVRALMRLVSVVDGQVLWAATIDADNGGLFAVQDAIVAHVIDDLGPRLSATERTRIARSPTMNRTGNLGELFM
jgi:serine/threonine protein kinase